MFGKIAANEFRYMLLSPMAIVGAILFLLFAFFSIILDNIQIGSGGNVFFNAPYAVAFSMMVLTIFTVFLVPAFVGNAILRDTDHKMDGIVFATPIRKIDYLLGRFTGAFAALAAVLLSVPTGLFLGSLWPSQDPALFKPLSLYTLVYYCQAYLGLVVPALFVMSAIFFAVAAMTRNMLQSYLAAIGVLMFYLIGNNVLQGLELREVAALTDPFGLAAMAHETRYWTAADRNSRMVGWTGYFLFNRLIWLGVSAALVALAYRLFSFRTAGKKQKQSKPPAPLTVDPLSPAERAGAVQTGTEAAWAMLMRRLRYEVASVVKSATFAVIMIFSAFLCLLLLITPLFQNTPPAYPVTEQMISFVIGSFGLALIVVQIFFVGEIVWRERLAKIHEIVDATPVPNWVVVTGKLAGVTALLLGILVAGTVMSILGQLARGYTELELGLYLHRGIGYFLVNSVIISVLSLVVQALSPNRFVGMAIMLVYVVGSLSLNAIGFEHPLYNYGSLTNAPLSDMNLSGRFIIADYWLSLYWGAFAVLLCVFTYLIWTRGTQQPLRYRLRRLADLRRPGYAAVAGVALITWIGSGAYIFYNTNVLNDYVTSDDLEDIAVAYEEKYRQYEDLPMPKIVAVDLEVHLYPYRRRVEVAGTHVLENKTDGPIETVHLVWPDFNANDYELEGATVEQVDDAFDYHILSLDTPMQPGERRTLRFDAYTQQRGFRHARNDVSLVRNGTFLNNFSLTPYVGFAPQNLLQDRNERRKRGLEPLDRFPDLDDRAHWDTNYLRQDSDYIDFEATISTVADQIALAPGYLQREWTENGRRYFHYEMDAPILNFYSFLSADYAVVRDTWRDIAIEVYHHPQHVYNVDNMIKAVKDSLAYFSEAFSPYQYRQLRIVEFPYRSFAQSFPNTVPFSENIGFIQDVRNPDKIDMPYYVTAHEVAHQWWAHQVMSANVEGQTMLIESLAQYGALMVMEETYGSHQLRKFLKLELDRYLAGRAFDPEGELPLYRVENQQYIHYRKASILMYALKDYLGEAVVNRALARLIDEFAYQSDPYARTVDFIRILREEAGPKHDRFITDQLMRIVTYDLEVTEAEVSERPDGRWQVTLEVAASKSYFNGKGAKILPDDDPETAEAVEARTEDGEDAPQTDFALGIPVDIGVFTRSPADKAFSKDDILYLQKRSLDGEQSARFEIIVDEKPTRVGIDPFIKLIDLNQGDNIKTVNQTELASAE